MWGLVLPVPSAWTGDYSPEGLFSLQQDVRIKLLPLLLFLQILPLE